MEKAHLKVKILGTTFSIQSNDEHEHLEDIIHYYRSKIDEITDKALTTDPLKTAILAGLNVVDELLKERNNKPGTAASVAQSELSASELNKITERMINKINTTLND